MAEPLAYPTEQVVGIAEDRATLERIDDALDAAGIDDRRIEVLRGDEAARRLDTGTQGRGPLTTAVRTVQKALGDEAVRLDRLNHALTSGAYVVQVALAGDDAAAREASKQAAGAALTDAGASDVAFYGRWQIEELQLGT